MQNPGPIIDDKNTLEFNMAIYFVCVQSQMGHALDQGLINQGQPEFTSSPYIRS